MDGYVPRGAWMTVYVNGQPQTRAVARIELDAPGFPVEKRIPVLAAYEAAVYVADGRCLIMQVRPAVPGEAG